MTRLLILNPSELTRDPRARRAAQTGREHGFDVVGLCGQRAGEEPLPLEGIDVRRLPADRMSGTLRRAGLGGFTEQRPFVRELRGIYRLLRTGRQNLRLVRAGRRLGRFDVVHANENDSLPAGWLLARRSAARLVYDAHELYSTSEPNYPVVYRAVTSRIESALARRADAVTAVSEPIGEELQRRFRLRARPLTVLNAPEVSGEDPVPGGTGPLSAIYQGAMGASRPLSDLLDAAEAGDGWVLTIRVAGADPEALRREVKQRGLADRVEIADPVPPTELVQALRGYEVGIILNRPLTLNDELVFPNKLFEYLMAGLAVAAPRLPGLTPLVEGDAVGVTFEPGRPDRLGAALSALAVDRPRLEALRRTARQLALERYNAQVQGEILVRAWRP